jgi:hypothetical protein
VARSVEVDTSPVSAVDFGIDAAERERLIRVGRVTAERFLLTWDYQAWLAARGPQPESSGRSSSA